MQVVLSKFQKKNIQRTTSKNGKYNEGNLIILQFANLY